MTSKPTSRGRTNDAKLVRELADILNETDLAEIEMKKGDLKIRVSRNGGAVAMAPMAQVAAAPMAAAAAPAPAPAAAAQSAPEAAPTDDMSSHPGCVKSPMVGTAYTRPSPDADPFVNIGDSVKEGDTVMLVEAMKTFNPITAPSSGKITHVLVDDAQPVEFGEPLFVIG